MIPSPFRRDDANILPIAEARLWTARSGPGPRADAPSAIGDGPPPVIPPPAYGAAPPAGPPDTPSVDESPDGSTIPLRDTPPAALRYVSPEPPHRPGPFARLRGLVHGDEIDPGRPGVRVLVLVGVLAVLVAVVYWWRSRPSETAVPEPTPVASPAGTAAGTAAETGAGTPVPSGRPSPAPSPTAVVVDVGGKVRHPGVVTLPPGSRVVDAIRAAGGIKPGTHTGVVNLARVVRDGEQILVGTKSRHRLVPTGGSVPPGSVPPGAVPPGGTPTGGPGGTVSLNSAAQQQLEALPGVGPVLAQRIIDYRTQHGGFRSVDDLKNVSGIGPATFKE